MLQLYMSKYEAELQKQLDRTRANWKFGFREKLRWLENKVDRSKKDVMTSAIGVGLMFGVFLVFEFQDQNNAAIVYFWLCPITSVLLGGLFKCKWSHVAVFNLLGPWLLTPMGALPFWSWEIGYWPGVVFGFCGAVVGGIAALIGNRSRKYIGAFVRTIADIGK